MDPENSTFTLDELRRMGFNITKSDFEIEIVDMEVEHFCPRFSQISLVVTIPLLFVVVSVACGDLLLIFNSCRSQQPNSKPVHLPTVCFASGNLLNVLVLLYLQFYFTVSDNYYCEIVNITRQFQILVLVFFCTHLLVAAVRFCILICRPSFQLSENVASPKVRTTLVVIWFQAVSHCVCVLVNLVIFEHVPDTLNLVTFCLLMAVPVLTVALFIMSQAAKHCRKMRRYREWTGDAFPLAPISRSDCVIFKWVVMTACTVLLFWLPFWTKNVYDYITNPESALEAFDFYTWIVVDILLLSNSLIIHLI